MVTKKTKAQYKGSGANPIKETIESVAGYPDKLKIFKVECSPHYWARDYLNDLRKDRQMQGIELAKRKGIKFGRKFSLTDDQVTALREKRSRGIKIVDLMAEFKVSKASVYRVLSDYSEVGTVSPATFVVAGTDR